MVKPTITDRSTTNESATRDHFIRFLGNISVCAVGATPSVIGGRIGRPRAAVGRQVKARSDLVWTQPTNGRTGSLAVYRS